MDHVIERKPKLRRKWIAVLAASGLVSSVVAWASLGAAPGYSPDVDAGQLEIGAVATRTLADALSLRASFVPKKTMYLDAVEGGRIERIAVREGDLVQAGQVLLEMSNAALELDVISREAQIVEQLNALQNTRLAIEQNRVSLQKDLANFEHQIANLEREAKQQALLVQKQLISQDRYQRTQVELDYLRRARELTLDSQRIDDDMRKTLIAQLEASTAQQNRNLAIARKNLESLVIRAPIAGRLSSFKAELGESKGRGARLGQIDDPDAFKLVASVDEFYLDSIQTGQRATASLAGAALELAVARIDPQVEGGKFRVEFTLSEGAPAGVRRGQNLNLELALSEAADVLSVPVGGFIQDTGGQWAFVLDAKRKRALRRPLRLGRRNHQYVEVLAGLNPGEQIITSPYGEWARHNQLSLAKE